MFIAILKYVKPVEEMDRLLPAHRDHLKHYFDQKKLLVAGRQNPRTGGVIISATTKREEFEEIMKKDPYVTSHAVQYQIIEFVPGLYDECLKHLLS